MRELEAILRGNYLEVQDRVAAACQSARRAPDEITVVGVTKYVDAHTAAAMLAVGCVNLGESRPQELWDKAAHTDLVMAQWHLVGHLQRNKVRRTLPVVSLIHSVDSHRLLETINEEAPGHPVSVLLEVNTSGDDAKHGLKPDAVEPLLAMVPDYPHVQVLGLMTMAAREGGPTVARKNFAALRELREKLLVNSPVELAELSMGMSGDFEEAIAEGSTILRLGSLLFHGVDRRAQ